MGVGYVFGMKRKALGIDIGSSNTTVVVDKRREILFEPTFVAYASNRQSPTKAIEFGAGAKAMNGKAPPSIRVVRPLRQGAIANFESAAHLVGHLMDRIKHSFFVPHTRFEVFASVPEAATNVEKRAIKQSLITAGAGKVTLLRKPIVAAIGAGLDVQRPVGSLVVDIGGGTCEISIISLSDLIVSRSLRIGGENMDEEIVAYLKKTHSILVGEGTAEEIKDSIRGSLADSSASGPIRVKGRHAITGLPTEAVVDESEIVAAVTPVIDLIADAIRDTIEQAPPDIMADVLEAGIMLTGGVARLHGIGPALSERLGLGVHVAEEPDHVVARGLTAVLKSHSAYKHIYVDAD